MKNKIPKEDYYLFTFGTTIIVVFFCLLLWMTLSTNGCL